MKCLYFLAIFAAHQFGQSKGEITKTFSAVQNADVASSSAYYKTKATRSCTACALFCLVEEDCKGSVFTGENCNLMCHYVLSSQLQDVSGHQVLLKGSCTPQYTGILLVIL